jgi:hypothetical protein
MNKEKMAYVDNGILFSHKEEQNVICRNMDGIIQIEKDKYHVFSLSCNLELKINKK